MPSFSHENVTIEKIGGSSGWFIRIDKNLQQIDNLPIRLSSFELIALGKCIAEATAELKKGCNNHMTICPEKKHLNWCTGCFDQCPDCSPNAERRV